MNCWDRLEVLWWSWTGGRNPTVPHHLLCAWFNACWNHQKIFIEFHIFGLMSSATKTRSFVFYQAPVLQIPESSAWVSETVRHTRNRQRKYFFLKNWSSKPAIQGFVNNKTKSLLCFSHFSPLGHILFFPSSFCFQATGSFSMDHFRLDTGFSGWDLPFSRFRRMLSLRRGSESCKIDQ